MGPVNPRSRLTPKREKRPNLHRYHSDIFSDIYRGPMPAFFYGGSCACSNVRVSDIGAAIGLSSTGPSADASGPSSVTGKSLVLTAQLQRDFTIRMALCASAQRDWRQRPSISNCVFFLISAFNRFNRRKKILSQFT